MATGMRVKEQEVPGGHSEAGAPVRMRIRRYPGLRLRREILLHRPKSPGGTDRSVCATQTRVSVLHQPVARAVVPPRRWGGRTADHRAAVGASRMNSNVWP